MCDTHADVVSRIESGMTFEEVIAEKIGSTISWAEATSTQIYDLNDEITRADL